MKVKTVSRAKQAADKINEAARKLNMNYKVEAKTCGNTVTLIAHGPKASLAIPNIAPNAAVAWFSGYLCAESFHDGQTDLTDLLDEFEKKKGKPVTDEQLDRILLDPEKKEPFFFKSSVFNG